MNFHNICSLVTGFVAATIVTMVIGCAQPESRHDQLTKSSQTAPPVDRFSDNYEWAKRLMASDSAEGVQQVNAISGGTMTLPVPIPPSVAATGVGFALLVNQQTQQAWLQSVGVGYSRSQQLHGPWKLDHPDVAHLLHSVTMPPTGNMPVSR